MKNCAHIAAAAANNVIGIQNKLPWNIPEDLKFFKNKTQGSTVIMGRKTFESLGSPLPKRLNIVVSRSRSFEGVLMASGIDEAIKKAQKEKNSKEIFIIGGGDIYKQSLDKVQKIYLTRIHKNYEGDAFYPEVPKDQFHLIEKIDRKGNPDFSFLTYVRRKESLG